MKLSQWIPLLFIAALVSGCQTSTSKKKTVSTPETSTENLPLKESRQLTFAGKRSNRPSFDPVNQRIAFQSERWNKSPFEQIYVKDFTGSTVKRVSPIHGQSGQAKFHPTRELLVFSSNHLAPGITQRAKDEFKKRNSGKKRRYGASYDPHTDLFSVTSTGRRLRNLTRTFGYDGEASISPDGQWIIFSSNRHAYSKRPDKKELAAVAKRGSSTFDLYLMSFDGKTIKRLTTTPGYDGGATFSPDGQKIVWFHFPEKSHSSELYSMGLDGSNKKALTKTKVMAIDPVFHPSGDYIVYATSIHGYRNFELYAIDAAGKNEPLRVTNSRGYDGAPTFSADGTQLVWTKKLLTNQSQLFTGKWDDKFIRAQLNLPKPQGTPFLKDFSPEIRQADVKKLIHYLASAEMKGRNTGSPEEKIYTAKIADMFRKMGLKPYGTKGSYFQEFDFVKEVELGDHNYLKVSKAAPTPDLLIGKNWTPLAFSKSGTLKPAPVVFAGYGIVAPSDGTLPEYNSYKGLDVKDRWVMMFRYLPEEISAKKREQLLLYSNLRAKALSAKMRGAAGVILVSGPNAPVKSELIAFNKKSVSSAGVLHMVSITNELAQNLLGEKQNLKALQTSLDKGEQKPGFELTGLLVGSHVTIHRKKAKGRNVLALLPVPGAKTTMIIGGHGDHLGVGKSPSSLMNSSDTTDIHFGADDNASGVSGVFELAHQYSQQVRYRQSRLKQNLLFAVWSGEEIGVLGSNHFSKYDSRTGKKRRRAFNREFSAYINMDMIGRFKKHLSVQGVGSSAEWPRIIEELAPKTHLPLVTQEDPYLPTDAMPFYIAKIPVLSFFTGVHSDYHSPRDTPDKINLDGAVKTIKLVGNFVDHIGQRKYGPKYLQVDQSKNMSSRSRGFRVSLGTIPDYSHSDVKGVLLSGVVKGGSAEKAGVRSGDVIVKLGTINIESIYDYVYSLQSIKPNKKTKIIVLRNGEKTELDIVPQSKE